MTCPDEIAAILLEILRHGLLSIRAAGASGDAPRCAADADHLHNLPGLLAHFSPGALRYYWEVERRIFLNELGPSQASLWHELWDPLRPYAEAAIDG
jgi:hypothetical protein